MWVWRFYGCHKTAADGGCFLWTLHFSASVSVWDKRFPARAVHGAMLKPTRCACESMHRLIFPPQEPIDSAIQSSTSITKKRVAAALPPSPSPYKKQRKLKVPNTLNQLISANTNLPLYCFCMEFLICPKYDRSKPTPIGFCIDILIGTKYVGYGSTLYRFVHRTTNRLQT